MLTLTSITTPIPWEVGAFVCAAGKALEGDNRQTGDSIHYSKMWMLLQGCTAAAEPEWEPPTADCPLRCPSSRKISKLTVKVYQLSCSDANCVAILFVSSVTEHFGCHTKHTCANIYFLFMWAVLWHLCWTT